MKRSLKHVGTRSSFWSCPRRQPSCRPTAPVLGAMRTSCTSSAQGDETDEESTIVKVSQHYATSGTTNGASAVWSVEKEQATRLVDRLMRETSDLMGRQSGSNNRPQTPSHDNHHHLIAFSGGIDSSLVAALVHHERRNNESVRAILGISPAVPAEQIALARSVAKHIGVPLQEVETREGQDEEYVANQGQACLACKTHLYSTLQAILRHVDITPHQRRHHDQNISIYNGTNADDLQDPTRLGLIAANRFGVWSPLRQITKAHVRLAARHLGLPNWNTAASPCLRSRLALGVEATREHLEVIERAERFVKQKLESCLTESTNLRVRLLAKNHACIEVDDQLLDIAQKVDWDDYFVGQLQFASVHARAFRSGSVATK